MSYIDSLSGEATKLLAAKLNSETATALWKELEVFFARGQLLVVSKDQDLIEVAMAVHLDKKPKVEQLLQSGKLVQPDADWVKQHCTAETLFWAVVVAPFVIIQLKHD